MKEVRKRPLQDRIVEVVNDTPTGEVLLDEALKYMKMEQQSVLTWIDLLCGMNIFIFYNYNNWHFYYYVCFIIFIIIIFVTIIPSAIFNC